MILQYPDFNKQFILMTDASDIACGAVLSQQFENSELPIAFASKPFTKGEKNKPVVLKELTAINWAINYFKPYLYGKKFVVRTDHRPLVFLFGMKNPNSKLTNMRLDLEEFDFVVEYIQGKTNVIADALSRIVTTSEELKNINILKVNTRAMTRKQNQTTTPAETPKVTVSKEPDHLSTYVTENPSITNKLHKLRISYDNNVLGIRIQLFVPSIFKLRNKMEVTRLTLFSLSAILMIVNIGNAFINVRDTTTDLFYGPTSTVIHWSPLYPPVIPCNKRPIPEQDRLIPKKLTGTKLAHITNSTAHGYLCTKAVWSVTCAEGFFGGRTLTHKIHPTLPS